MGARSSSSSSSSPEWLAERDRVNAFVDTPEHKCIRTKATIEVLQKLLKIPSFNYGPLQVKEMRELQEEYAANCTRKK